MNKKYLTLLIIPLIAITLLFGCKKDSMSLEDSRNLYIEMIDSYITKDASGNAANFIFKEDVVKYDSTNTATAEDGENILYIILGDNSEAASDEMKSLYTLTHSESAPAVGVENPIVSNANKLYQYTSVYQSIITPIFEYYDTWQERVYNNLAENATVSQDDVDDLYYATKELKEEVANFYAQKSLFEEDVDAFGTGNAIINASIDVLNYHYNKLIKASFSFINTFINVQDKYFPIDESQLYYASMIYGQSVVNLTESLFYSNVESMESGEYCNIEHLTYSNVEDGNTMEHLIYDETEGDIGFVTISDVGTVSMRNMGFIEGKSVLSASDINKVAALSVTNKNFSQQFEIYGKARTDFPTYEYKCALFNLQEYSTSSATTTRTIYTFTSRLGFEDTARKSVIDTFENVTIVRVASNLNNFAI